MTAFESRPNLRLLQDDVVTAEIQEFKGKQNSKLNSRSKEQSPPPNTGLGGETNRGLNEKMSTVFSR